MRSRCPAAIAACLLAAMTPARNDGAFMLGVVRRDGVIIPFATFDGRRWGSDWPPPRDRVEVPINLRSVPSRWWGPMAALDTWQVLVGEGPPRTVRVRQPDWFDAQCLKQVGLRTDYRPGEPPPGPDAQPYPKDGLAVSPSRDILPIAVVPVGAAPPQVVDQFNIQEREAIAREQRYGQWAHPLTRTEREATSLKTEAIYAEDGPGAHVYFFEVSKEYARPAAQGQISKCVGVSYGAGWFVKEGGSLRALDFGVAIAPCNRYGLLYMLPLGAMNISHRLFWVAQLSGWDYEEYDITEIKPKEVDSVLHVSGGRC